MEGLRKRFRRVKAGLSYELTQQIKNHRAKELTELALGIRRGLS